MKAKYQERLEELIQNQQNVNAEILQVRNLIRNCEARLRELETEGSRLAGKAEMLKEVISMNRQETAEPVAVEAVGALRPASAHPAQIPPTLARCRAEAG
jgi:DNA repair ATPase RecN